MAHAVELIRSHATSYASLPSRAAFVVNSPVPADYLDITYNYQGTRSRTWFASLESPK